MGNFHPTSLPDWWRATFIRSDSHLTSPPTCGRATFTGSDSHPNSSLPEGTRLSPEATITSPPPCLGTHDFHLKRIPPHHPHCLGAYDFPYEARSKLLTLKQLLLYCGIGKQLQHQTPNSSVVVNFIAKCVHSQKQQLVNHRAVIFC